MMYIRLKIAKELITDEGLIVVAIDDHELFNLGLMLDQLFGEQNRIGIIPVRNNPAGRANSRYLLRSMNTILYILKIRMLLKLIIY